MRIIDYQKELNDTNEYKNRLSNAIEDERKFIKKIESKISELKTMVCETEKEKWKNEKKIEIETNKKIRSQNKLNTLEQQLKFARPDTQENIAYRLDIYDNFANKMKSAIPNSLPLRFHGTSLWNTEQIIQSKSLSSSVDRLGISTSYDVEGQLSVTDSKTLDVTVNGYTHMLEQHEPAGCIFVLLPKNEQDARSVGSLLMDSVYLDQHLEQLYGIITTPENQSLVSEWCKKNDIQTNVMTFEEFEKQMDIEKQFSNAFEQIMSGMGYDLTDSQNFDISNIQIDGQDVDDLEL